jgi:dipeptidyl aminopeptidase/acylaminoacyl peptidase
MSKPKAAAAPLLVLLAILVPATGAAGEETSHPTFPASVTEAGSFADAGVKQSVSISGDGRYLAFVSAAQNLSPDQPVGVPEAYVKDLSTGQVRLVSRASGTDGEAAGEAPAGEQVRRPIEAAIVSGDGRYVLFTSQATNLAGGELPLAAEVTAETYSTHVYRRDMETGETLLVDRETGTDGETEPLEASGQAISADGRYVVFRAEATDLEDPDASHQSSGSGTLYVRDLQAGVTAAISRASGAEGELANERSFGGAFSANGRAVAFSTLATNPLLGTAANQAEQVYVRELQAPFATVLTSRSGSTDAAPQGLAANGESFEPLFVGAECRVGFDSAASNLVPGGGSSFEVYLRDACSANPTTTLLSRDPSGAPFAEAALQGASGDGRLVLFTGEGPGGPRHLYLRDLGAGGIAAVDRASGEGGVLADRAAEHGAISANGCRAAFTTAATNLAAELPPSGGGGEELLQAYVRQLGPCRPAPEEGVPGRPAGGGPEPPPVRTRLSILSLRPRSLRLEFSAPGKATVRIERLTRRHSRRIASLLVSAARAGEVTVRLPRLSGGHYRLDIRLHEPGSERLRRPFTVPAR